jgi:alkanesulfonate monooxygenase SsuD/methylene tetrahydromethanopterin reductase-like flavin-dependent oxidoreductase (luciferase family)
VRFAIGVPTVREYGDPCLLVELAREAESSGWDGFFVWDHLLYGHGDPVADPWTTTAAIAAATATVRLGVMVSALARRRPWKVARETATLDHLSGGRLVFGAGLGSIPEEYSGFGEDADNRVRAQRLDEGLDILTGLWTGERFAHRGRHYSVEPTVFLPTPLQSPRIPVWIAGRWPNLRPFRRAAQWDGVFPTQEGLGHDETMSPGQLRTVVAYTLEHREERQGALDVILEGYTPSHSHQAHELLAPYAEAGLTWWIEKIGWFRGSVEDMRRRVRQGPPAA